MQLIEHVEDVPTADPQAIVAPGMTAVIGRRCHRCRRMPQALAEGEDLDIGGEMER